jgi:NitT/TauT family transport system substrate-binding protein
MRLRLYENYRFVLYAPFYAAHAIGAYATEGLTVELLPSPGVGLAEQGLRDGTVDVIWAGPMRVMKHHDMNPGSALVCFAEIVCRDPFSIVGGRPNPDFRLTDLGAMRVATVSEVPTPWLCLQEDLRQVGIDPGRVARVGDRSMAENLASVKEGRLDAVQLFEPFVEEALAANIGHLWYAASTRGRTTYTAFVTTRDRLAAAEEPLSRMVRAIFRTQQWVHQQSAQDIAAAIGPFFPSLDRAVLTGALSRYRAQGVWGRDPILPEEGFDRLRRALVSGGFISRPIDYAACVDNRLARQVATERSKSVQ